MPTAAVKINLADNTLAGNSAAVVAALNAAGVGEGTAYHVGNDLSGTITFDRANGRVQWLSLAGNATFDVTGGSRGDELRVLVDYDSGGLLTFAAGIRMEPAARALLDAAAIDLTDWRSVDFHFIHAGGGWKLVNMDGETNESTD
jgi:hypothetical protein